MSAANFVMALAMGAIISLYLPMISRMSQLLGSPTMGNVPFFAVALIASLVIALASGQGAEAFGRIPSLPMWLFLSGVASAVMIVGSSYLVPQIGTGAFFVLLVAGQILFGALINQFGLLGVPVQPITMLKLLGIVMAIAGAAIVSFAPAASTG
ncbi:MAG: hypothetical protein GKR99_08120 [Rhodobacteraceae bacterium]|nr:hypothetical protein [Paracoccaceae bacterium]